jgi:colanic acid/amylovoran biosynthesis protein
MQTVCQKIGDPTADAPATASGPAVGLMGASLGTGNRGVSALGASLVRLVKGAMPGAKPFMLIGSRDTLPFELGVDGRKLAIPIVNFRRSLRAGITSQLWWILLAAVFYRCLPIPSLRRLIAKSTPWIRSVTGAQLIGEIRGGDSFSDIYGLVRFINGSLPVISVILVGGNLVLLPQTYGPYRTRTARWLARYILRGATLILSRDRESIQEVEQLIGPAERCMFCPDVALALEARCPEVVSIKPPLPSPSPALLVGINVSGLMANGGYNRDNMFGLKLDYPRFTQQMCVRLLADRSLHLLMVPHTYAPAGRVESDPEACERLRNALPSELQARVHLVNAEYDQNELKGIIGLCDFFVGSRMHACIAALSQGIPTVGVAYSKKFLGVFETVGTADTVISGMSCDTEQAVEITLRIFQRREAIRTRLRSSVPEAQTRLRSVFASLLNPRDSITNPGNPGDAR